MSKTSGISKQDAPTPGKEIVLHRVISDLNERAEMGKKLYGSYLMTHNGRSALQDLYEEMMDSIMYLAQILMEIEDKNQDVYNHDR